jgi:hypothetical protein
MEENNVKSWFQKIDWPLVLTLIVTALILAAIVYGLKKSGVKSLKQIADNV